MVTEDDSLHALGALEYHWLKSFQEEARKCKEKMRVEDLFRHKFLPVINQAKGAEVPKPQEP